MNRKATIAVKIRKGNLNSILIKLHTIRKKRYPMTLTKNIARIDMIFGQKKNFGESA
jgi:hypothetical protein